MLRKSFLRNNVASAIPLILFVLTIFSVGAVYTLLFIEFGFPTLSSFIPDSDLKTTLMLLLYSIPFFVLIVGVIALIVSGLKRTVMLQ